MRPRRQSGWVELRGSAWYANWYVYILDPITGKDRRCRRSKKIGTKRGMTKSEAVDELAKLVAPINAIHGASLGDNRVTLGWFYDNRFKPLREAGWGVATRQGYETDMRLYIRPYLGDVELGKIDSFACQIYLNKLAEKNLSEWVVMRVRTTVSSVLEMARKSKFIPENPMEDTRMPLCKPTKKPTISREQIRLLFRAITDTRDRLILEIGTFCALTASELFGLKWDCYQGDHLIIRNTAYKGKLYEWRVKKKTRFRQVPITAKLAKRIEAWKKESKGSGLMFPGEDGNPLWPNIWLQKKVQSIAAKIGIVVPVTFQVLRRSCATRNQKHGSIKDVQEHLGHSNIDTTGNVYMQAVSESVRDMVEADYADVMRGMRRVN